MYPIIQTEKDYSSFPSCTRSGSVEFGLHQSSDKSYYTGLDGLNNIVVND